MKKIIVFATLVALCIPFLFLGVSAEDMNYLDYITDITVSEEYNIVTCKFPASPFSMTIYPELSNAVRFSKTEKVLYPFQTTQSYNLMITPSANNYLWLGNLPDDTELNVYLDIAYFDPSSSSPRPERQWEMQVGGSFGRFYYYDSNHQVLTDYTNYEVSAGLFDSNGVTDTYMLQGFIFDNPDQNTPLPDETAFVRPRLFLNNCMFYDYGGSDTVSAEFHLTEYEVVIFIDSLILGGEYGEVLDQINNALARQGKHINTITGAIERIPIPQTPKDYGDIKKILLNEDNFNEFAKDYGFDSARSILGGMNELLTEFRTPMLAVSTLMTKFIELPGVVTIIMTSAGVGLVGIFVGLMATLDKSLPRAQDDYGKIKKGSLGDKKG